MSSLVTVASLSYRLLALRAQYRHAQTILRNKSNTWLGTDPISLGQSLVSSLFIAWNSSFIWHDIAGLPSRWSHDPIDTYSIFSNTILHELFHTFSSAKLGDIGKACTWEYISPIPKQDAIKNADSAMYFSLGLDLIQQVSRKPKFGWSKLTKQFQGLIPQLDGTVKRAWAGALDVNW